MKDMRGNHSLAVRNAIYKEFGLSSSIKRKTINDVSEWKKSSKVKESYEMLYNSDFNSIENITKIAFPSLMMTKLSKIFIVIQRPYVI